MHSLSTSDRAFLGNALHTPSRGQMEVLRNVVIVTGTEGRIEAIHPHGSQNGESAVKRHAAAGTLVTLKAGQYLLPGLIDLHVHAPQWPQLGLALDLPLEVWLQKYTFPLEAPFADIEYATPVYESLVEALLANGTTTAVYYATIHLPATKKLA